jgi:Cof subfamily protein (haloacid dehalogenase superfamily)
MLEMKIIATDMDGTLLNNEEEVSKENVEAIKKAQEQGIEVIIATGRGYIAAVEPLAKAGLQIPVIGLNGAEIRTAEGELLHSVPLGNDLYYKIQQACQRQDIYFEVFTNHGTYTDNLERSIQAMIEIVSSTNVNYDEEKIRAHVMHRVEVGRLKTIESYNHLFDLSDIEFYKVLTFSRSEEKLRNVGKELEGEKELAITASARDNLEINHINAQKGIALEKFAKERGVEMKDVMALGDNFNDVSMLRIAGRSVAMENAEQEIKDMCHFVTKKNIEHGVGHAIEQLLKDLVK